MADEDEKVLKVAAEGRTAKRRTTQAADPVTQLLAPLITPERQWDDLKESPSRGPWVWVPRQTAGTDYHVWSSAEQIPNLEDYNPIIVISPESDHPTVRKNLRAFKEQIRHIFEAGRLIVWILTPKRTFKPVTVIDESYTIDNHSWWPGKCEITPIPESHGKKCTLLPLEGLERYIKMSAPWSLALEFLSSEYTALKQFKLPSYFLKTVGGQGLGATLEVSTGVVIVLPPIPQMTPEAMVGILLREVFTPEKRLPPSWVQAASLLLSGEEVLLKQVDKISQKIEGLELKRLQLQKEQATLDDYRRILYETGPNLENAVRQVLSKMELTVENRTERKREDLVIRTTQGPIYTEIKGTRKGAKADMLRQAAEWALSGEEIEGKLVKALLILNHQCERPLTERKMGLASNLKKSIKKYEICLLTCVELFKGLQKVMRGELEKEDIEKVLYERVGECTF